MGIPVLILGESGSGKSTSLRNFNEDEIGIFNVASKPLPFRKKLPTANNANYRSIMKGLSAPKLKRYAIDDSQYLMTFESFERVGEKGYEKFTQFALSFYSLIQFVIKNTPEDVIVYFLHHCEMSENGKIKAKTIGKMLDTQLTLEGLFSIVLLCKTDGGKYYFETQSDGNTTAKSPIDMFEKEIDNDLKFVDGTIREYLSKILNGQKFESPKCRISYRKSSAVEIENEEYFLVHAKEKYLTKRLPIPNKAVIKEALKDGEKIDGDRLVEKQNMTIK